MNIFNRISDDPLFTRVSLFLAGTLILSGMVLILYLADRGPVNYACSNWQYFYIFIMVSFFLWGGLYLLYAAFSTSSKINNTLSSITAGGPAGLDELLFYIIFGVSIGIIAFLITWIIRIFIPYRKIYSKW